jgi:hypothetical protein
MDASQGSLMEVGGWRISRRRRSPKSCHSLPGGHPGLLPLGGAPRLWQSVDQCHPLAGARCRALERHGTGAASRFAARTQPWRCASVEGSLQLGGDQGWGRVQGEGVQDDQPQGCQSQIAQCLRLNYLLWPRDWTNCISSLLGIQSPSRPGLSTTTHRDRDITSRPTEPGGAPEQTGK